MVAQIDAITFSRDEQSFFFRNVSKFFCRFFSNFNFVSYLLLLLSLCLHFNLVPHRLSYPVYFFPVPIYFIYVPPVFIYINFTY